MTKVEKSVLPAKSALWALHRTGDFVDCYSCDSALPPKTAAERAMQIPNWASLLMRLRNAVVVPLGLKSESDAGPVAPTVFPITLETEDEVLFGFDDRHLNFRIAMLRDKDRIFMSTWVHPHNFLGRVYLALVMPFHVLIVRNAMRRLASG